MILRDALRFFTRLPVGKSEPIILQGIIAWLPVVGLVVGTLAALAVWLAALVFPPVLCGAVGCFAWAAITGGLHLDGVSDCGDAFLAEAPREQRLIIMKDSRLGAFGAAALFFALFFKATALCVISETIDGSLMSLFSVISCCCMAAVLGRSAVFLGICLPSAKPGGLGNLACQRVTVRHGLLAAVLAVVICAINGLTGLYGMGAALLATWLLMSATRKKLGGVTGDVFGCLIELTECAVLLACCL